LVFEAYEGGPDFEPGARPEEGIAIRNAIAKLTKKTFDYISDDERIVWINAKTEVKWTTKFQSTETFVGEHRWTVRFPGYDYKFKCTGRHFKEADEFVFEMNGILKVPI
jgi:hypothetical protein